MNIAYRFAAAAVDEAARNAASVADDKAQTALDELGNLVSSGVGGPRAIGAYADRSAYDAEEAGFVYRANDGTATDATAGTGTVAWDFVRIGMAGWSAGARVTGGASSIDELDGIGTAGIAVAKAGTEDAALAAVGLQSADVRAALKAADLDALRAGIGLGEGDNLLMTAAERTKLAAVDEAAEANPTGADIVAAVDAMLGQTAWQTGGGGLDTSETALTPTGGGFQAFDDASDTWIATSTPDPLPAPNALDPIGDWENSGWTVNADTTLTGLPAKSLTANSSSNEIYMGTLTGVQSGDTVTFAVVVDTTGVDDVDDKVVLWIKDTSGNETLLAFRPVTNAVARSGAFDAIANLTSLDDTGGSFIHDADGASNIWLLVGRWSATGPVDDLTAFIESNSAGDDLVVAGVYFGIAPYDPSASDGSEAVLLPDASAAGTVTMTTDANQRVTIDAAAAYTLVLPEAPGSGVRDLTLRATISAGSLVMPASGVKLFGQAGPFTADTRIVVRQYGDGSDADIVAVPEAV